MTPIITLTRGLPASGKSTWAKAQVAASKGQILRVNLDDIRAMLGFGHGMALPWNKELEKTAYDVQDKIILAAIAAGKHVIVDNTHIQMKGPERIKKLFDGEVFFKVKDFTDVSTKDCIARDSYRANPVGSEVIKRMRGQLKKDFDLAAYMNDYAFPLVPLEYDPNLPWVIVFDTDGTTALHNRSPYDYGRLYTDSVNENVVTTLRVLQTDPDLFFFGMSGRPGDWRELSEAWYADVAQLDYDEFYMRPSNDRRNDADIKHEMVEKYIRGKYNVLMWFDDRDRVVRRLRKLGITVAQVAYGNF